jgi:hypothetical protein
MVLRNVFLINAILRNDRLPEQFETINDSQMRNTLSIEGLLSAVTLPKMAVLGILSTWKNHRNELFRQFIRPTTGLKKICHWNCIFFNLQHQSR